MKKLLTLIPLAFALTTGPAQGDAGDIAANAMLAYQIYLEQLAAQGDPAAQEQLIRLYQADLARMRFEELREQREQDLRWNERKNYRW